MLFCRLRVFQNQLFRKIHFRNQYHLSVKLFGFRSGWHFVGPDPGPICLQRLWADDTSRQQVTICIIISCCWPESLYTVKRILKNSQSKDLYDKWKLNEGGKYFRMFPLEHSAILAIISLENQFLVFLRVAVLHRFFVPFSDSNWLLYDYKYMYQVLKSGGAYSFYFIPGCVHPSMDHHAAHALY